MKFFDIMLKKKLYFWREDESTKKQKITHFVKTLSKLEKQIISFPYFTKREISGGQLQGILG